jgi:prephenate dehydrogenase
LKNLNRVLIVGAGLIGTSLGLALREKYSDLVIDFKDLEPSRASLARDLVSFASIPSNISMVDDGAPSDLVIIATPINSIFPSLISEYNLNQEATFIDIGGLKSELVAKVEEIPALASRFLATHPMAGREVSGPTAARADLFQGRTWILTPTRFTNAEVAAEIYDLIRSLGALPIALDAINHDRAIAQVSHLPQVLSSLLSANLKSAQESDLHLAGQGLRDVTRLGDSSPELWQELLLANRAHLLPLLRNIQNDLSLFTNSLAAVDEQAIYTALSDGNIGRKRLPGKHGGAARSYSLMPIVIDDRPGQLAKIIEHCAQAAVNIEDIAIEHSPGQLTGLVTLSLSNSDAEKLQTHLMQSKEEWRFHGPIHPSTG